MTIDSALRTARRVTSGRTALALCCFLAGAAVGSVADPSAEAQGNGGGGAQAAKAERALRSVIYAVTALAVDTEIVAVEIAEIKNRLDQLEVLAEGAQRSKREQ